MEIQQLNFSCCFFIFSKYLLNNIFPEQNQTLEEGSRKLVPTTFAFPWHFEEKGFKDNKEDPRMLGRRLWKSFRQEVVLTSTRG